MAIEVYIHMFVCIDIDTDIYMDAVEALIRALLDFDGGVLIIR